MDEFFCYSLACLLRRSTLALKEESSTHSMRYGDYHKREGFGINLVQFNT